MLTSDKSFYEKLTGEHWLFFDVSKCVGLFCLSVTTWCPFIHSPTPCRSTR